MPECHGNPLWSQDRVHTETGFFIYIYENYVDDSVQDCGNSNELAMELLQSCTEPSMHKEVLQVYFDGLVQDCSNSIANALELLQSCTKPSI